MGKVSDVCEAKLRPVIEEMGYELLEVSYEKENGGMSLIFYIDKDGGVTINDCEMVTKKIDPIIDEINPTDDKPYTLVVSSPELDRPIKTDKDLKRNLGKEVEVNLFAKIDGVKNFVGVLESFSETEIVLKSEKLDVTLERDKIASIKLVIKF